MNRHELRLAFRPLSFLDSLSDDEKGVLELRKRRWLVWHPDTIGWVFRSDQALWHSASRTLSPLLGSKSLLWMDGSEHTAYRRVLGPALRGHHLTAYRGIIADTVHSAIGELTPGSVVSLADWTRKLTLRVISRIILGGEDDALLMAFSTWLERELGCRGRTLARRYLCRGTPRYDHEVDRMLLRSAKNAKPSALAALLPATDDRELRDQLVSLLFAGHETTASATAWTLYWLDREPELRDQVVAELDTADDDADDDQVPLLRAAIHEALRLCPPATLATNRVTDEGVILTPSIYLAHHSADRFPNPNTFDATRFLGKRVSGHHYFPFGGGTRHCLGSELALLEIRMIITALLRRRRLRCVNPGACTPQLRGAALAPPRRLRMVTTCRRY